MFPSWSETQEKLVLATILIMAFLSAWKVLDIIEFFAKHISIGIK